MFTHSKTGIAGHQCLLIQRQGSQVTSVYSFKDRDSRSPVFTHSKTGIAGPDYVSRRMTYASGKLAAIFCRFETTPVSFALPVPVPVPVLLFVRWGGVVDKLLRRLEAVLPPVVLALS